MLVVAGRATSLSETSARVAAGEDLLAAVRDFLDQAGRLRADELAAERSLPAGWLNDAVKGLLASDDADAVPVLEVPGLSVAAGSARILLAMKVLAHRVGEDDDDVHLLASELGLASAQDVLALAEAV